MASSLPHVQERLVAAAAVVGGALIAIGAFLPWLSLFAGLHPLRGVIGLNGRLLAAGGGVCLVAGVRYWLRPVPGLERGIAVLGWALTGYALWLIAQLLITYRELRTNPMLVPRLGPGLFLALAGSLMAGTTTALRGAARAGTAAAGGSGRETEASESGAVQRFGRAFPSRTTRESYLLARARLSKGFTMRTEKKPTPPPPRRSEVTRT